MSFLYSFLNFLQPGILWPDIALIRPMLTASIIGLIVGLARSSDYPRKFAFSSPAFLWMTVFILAQIISVYYGGILAIIEEFSFWNVYPLFVVISVLLMADVTSIKRYVWGMMAGGMVIVAYGIYSVLYLGGYIGTGRAGAYGMYENHNDYSFIIIQILPFLYLYMTSETGLFRRALLGLSILASVLGMMMSLSRGGMIALVVEAFLIVLITMKGRRRLFLVPVIAVVGALAVGYQYAKRAENQSNYTAADAEAGRFELWKAGIRMLQANPVLGVGSRRFPEYASQYYDLSNDMRGKVSHNTLVEIFAGSGFVGFLSFIFFSYYLIRELRRKPLQTGPPSLEVTRVAVFISFLSILFRTFLDAKAHDWSIYTLCAIGLACIALQRQIDLTNEKKADGSRGS